MREVMQRLREFLGVVALILMTAPAWALEHYSNVAQDNNGRAIVGAKVTVYLAGTTTLATIYLDNGVTIKANPITTGLDGIYDFYAANGLYDIKIAKSGYTSIYWDQNKTKGLALFDPIHFIVPYGLALPLNPSPTEGDFFVLLNDEGSCIESSGVGKTLCRYDSATFSWVPIGGSGSVASGLDANFDLVGGNTITGASEVKKFNLFGDGGQNTSGWTWYRTSSGKSVFKCVEAGVEGNCQSYVELNAGKKWGLKNGGGSVILEADEATGKITIGAIDCTLAGVSCTVSDERHFPVATCQNVNPSANFDLPATNAATATCDSGSNTKKAYLAFNDSTDQAFYDHWVLPAGFVYADVHFRWKAAATTGSVIWCARMVRVPDGATSDPAFPVQSAINCVQDTAKDATLTENAATLIAASCVGCVAGDHVYVVIERDANGTTGTDNMAGDAFLLMYGRDFVVTK